MEKVLVLCLFFALSSLAYAGVENVLSSNADPPLVNGLSRMFYKITCPKLESIVQKRIRFYLKKDVTQATGLLRLHFHDCFVKGCDFSVLLDESASGPSEQEAPSNSMLRTKACDVVMSCADFFCRGLIDGQVEKLWGGQCKRFNEQPFVQKSVAEMERVVKGRKLLQPDKPKLDRGHDPQHN